MPENNDENPGIFGQYENVQQDPDAEEGDGEEKNGLWGSNDDDDAVRFDCEMRGVAKISSMRAWQSDNEKNAGNKYFKAIMVMKRIDHQEVHPEDNEQFTDISEGTEVMMLNELPKSRDPDMMNKGEEIRLKECLELGASLIGVKKQFFDPNNLDTMCIDDGARVRGRYVGINVEADVKEKEIQGQTFKFVYYNPSFFPVDQESLERTKSLTPDEKRAQAKANANAA